MSEQPLTPGSGSSQWHAGLFSIPDDKLFCLFAFCFGPCAIGKTRQEHDQSNCIFNTLFVSSPALRSIVRSYHKIEGDCVSDAIIGCVLGPCSVIQVSTEVNHRGAIVQNFTGDNQWSSELLGCTDDIVGFAMACCFGPCVAAQNRSKFDGSNCIFNFLFVGGALSNNVIREGYNIQGDCLTDILLSICPIVNALQTARVSREIASRGGVNGDAKAIM